MGACWLHGFGPCGGKLSGDHYIPDAVLRQSAAGNSTAVIGGMKWQPKETLERLGFSALTKKLYCRDHNSRLSPLDDTLKTFLGATAAIDKTPSAAKPLTQVRGAYLERALLKVVVGITAANHGPERLSKDWKPLLAGKPWPPGWGIYVPVSDEPEILDGHLQIEMHQSPDGKILAASFHLGGVFVRLLLGVPDNPSAFGIHRPRGLVFDRPDGEFRIEFLWSYETNECVTFTRQSTTTPESSPRTRGWKGPE